MNGKTEIIKHLALVVLLDANVKHDITGCILYIFQIICLFYTDSLCSFLSILCLFCIAESLRDYFSQFGEITEVMVMKDPTTRRTRYVLLYLYITRRAPFCAFAHMMLCSHETMCFYIAYCSRQKLYVSV